MAMGCLRRPPLNSALVPAFVAVCIAATGIQPPGWATDRASATENGRQTPVPETRDERLGSADPADAAPFQRPGRSRESGGVYKARIAPHWSRDNSHFWYRNDLRGGAREFVLVDAAAGTRRLAFDHARLAEALQAAGVDEVRADRLPIDALEFDLANDVASFRAGGRYWRCGLETYDLMQAEEPPSRADDRPDSLAPDAPRASTRNGPETELTFVNRTAGEFELFWLDGEGRRRSYGKVPAGERHDQHTYAGHMWEVVDGDGRTLTVFEAEESPATVEVTGRATPPRRRLDDSRRPRPPRDLSPDGKWRAFVRENNVFLRSEEDGTETRLSEDGSEGRAYGMLEWAPDSQSLVAFRIEPGDEKEVYRIESSPDGGGRARLHSRAYPLPGDKFAAHELSLFNVAEQRQMQPDVEPIDFGTPRLRWARDGHTFTYQKTDRGHQRFRLIEVDAHTGGVRNLIDEQTDTFIWTAHTENLGIRPVTWLEQTDEIIYVSERDGWRHLYLIDAASGAIKNQITRGDWVVRGVDRIDEQERQVWFRAGGREPDQDPYLIHYYRVDFDGAGLVALTDGDGNHTVQYSPDRHYLIDTYSRVDTAPVHTLRRVSDGGLVCQLERADISELEERGWEPPEVFVAKGRDGTTDIWGILCRPRDFDPHRKYPVIEDIYAGPQGSYVPKTFSPTRRYAALTDLGFVVAKIDGMGTANRSKAFHDVCWQDLKDAGLPDRILWHKAVAEKYPWYDVSRVGIYGTSAGGQNSTGAVLFHPEFYKVAVSACGCHDNRMDKASWNEQWMGYPVGPHYAACSNIDNAHRLEGKLLLIVGEMDDNVPPESTLRLADALIKAGKDFELIVVPGAGHGMGGAYGQRRMQDFFVRHLLGEEPPDRNRR
jgi:dipeptidyl aminopeptidase/acylaminoacyl peptidase